MALGGVRVAPGLRLELHGRDCSSVVDIWLPGLAPGGYEWLSLLILVYRIPPGVVRVAPALRLSLRARGRDFGSWDLSERVASGSCELILAPWGGISACGVGASRSRVEILAPWLGFCLPGLARTRSE
jgi:hypothetical protein